MTLDLYGENILEHFKNPVNKGVVKNPDATAREINPLCGDEVEVAIKTNGGHITEIKFNGIGCAISQAAADILMEQSKGKFIKEVATLDKEKFLKSLGVELSALRLKCALLAFKALKLAAIKMISKGE